MPSRIFTVKLTLTETEQFRRLVQFLNDVEDLARVNADAEFLALVEAVRDDLMKRGGSDDA